MKVLTVFMGQGCGTASGCIQKSLFIYLAATLVGKHQKFERLTDPKSMNSTKRLLTDKTKIWIGWTTYSISPSLSLVGGGQDWEGKGRVVRKIRSATENKGAILSLHRTYNISNFVGWSHECRDFYRRSNLYSTHSNIYSMSVYWAPTSRLGIQR